MDAIRAQRDAFDRRFAGAAVRPDDAVTRYLIERRLRVALSLLQETRGSALVVCGGGGNEGRALRHAGFESVTVSDISSEGVALAVRNDGRLKGIVLNAEQLEIPNDSFDVVLVQDGLHHLPRPVLGFTEMLRVARKAVVMIEPHPGVITRLIGHEWERQEGATNYVFRWNKRLVEQVANSYLGEGGATVHFRRIWDHNPVVSSFARRAPASLQLHAARAVYASLRPFDMLGNAGVVVVTKNRHFATHPDASVPDSLT